MQNYHKHSWFTNTLVSDCATSYEAYVARARELGHKVISSVEHGFQSNYYVPYELVQNNNNKLKEELESGKITKEEYDKGLLKFIFGAEAYWVKDRKREYPNGVNKKGEEVFAKDRTNCHIILLAKNEDGRRDINEALSDANIDGYYFQPRLDLELLLRIKPENVMVTTACVKYWVYEDIEDITVTLHDHFGDNFFLEVQPHNTDKQKQLNKRILGLSEKYGIDIICGLDSHYIYPEDEQERNNYLEGRGIVYDQDEVGWDLDYPSDEEVVKRFKKQGVLDDEQIKRAMDNTDLLLDFEDLFFDKDIKLPSLYPDEPQEVKDKILKDLVYSEWGKEKKNIPEERWDEYENGIDYELNAIIDTHMSDYFLIDHAAVKRGIQKGGIVTKTGRGSGVSYYVNKLLGFSDIDRFTAPIKLYPDRFMSKTRILLTKSLPDIDMNIFHVECFAEAQDEILTEAYGTPNHSYPMISYKPLQKSSAFKLYAKAQGLDFDIANSVTSDITRYERALKHADSPEDKEAINIYDYVPKEYHKYLDESKKYQGIINAKSQAPCGYLIYQGDIKREIGLIRCVSGSGKNEHSVLTTVIDGMVAENYKFVKNDWLTVDVWNNIYEVFKKVGIPTPSVNEMSKLVENDEDTWNVYASGMTCGVNQCESDFGKRCCKEYAPVSMQELTALVAALRPGFKTQLDNFLERKPYTTGVKALDNLLKDSFHYMMYQENIMTYLGWLGIDQTETYAIIKKISKKKFKEPELAELKERLLSSWKKKVGSSQGFEKTWEIVEASARYSFNASHAYSYAYDSVYGAYCKAHYPYEFYATMLQAYTDKGDKDKVNDFRVEMKQAFGIGEGEYKFRRDNRSFSIDKRRHVINPCLSSLKNFSQSIADQLYELRDLKCEHFTDLLLHMRQNTGIGMARIEDLIQIGYFSEFGNVNTLLHVYQSFDCLFDKTKKILKKRVAKNKVESYGLTEELVRAFCGKETDATFLMVDVYSMLCELETIEFAELPSYELASYEQAIAGKTDRIDKLHRGVVVVTDVNDKHTPFLKCYRLGSGKTQEFKIAKPIFANNPLVEGDAITIVDYTSRNKNKRINGEWRKDPKEKELWVSKYKILKKSKQRKKSDR